MEQRLLRRRTTRTTRPAPSATRPRGDQADHPGAQPDQRHPVPVQPAGRRPVLRAGPGRHPADHQPRRPQRKPARRRATPRSPPRNSGGWDYYDPWIWTSWFPMIEPSAASIPWMVATGNHDTELFSAQVAADHGDRGQLRAARLRRAGQADGPARTGPSACPSVYSFRYGNVGIISLDANELSWEIQGLLGYSDGAQVRWLEEQLAAWRGDPGIDFIVAFFHECAFSTCNGHSSDGGVRSDAGAAVRQVPGRPGDPGAQPRLRAHQPADLRRGDQQRPVQQAGGRRLPAEPAEVEPAKDGTTYVVVGTAGTPRYGWTGAARDRPQLRRRAGQRHHRDRRTPRRRPGPTSTSSTSASASKPSTGPRPGTPTTASSPSTSPRPRRASAPR